jgi:hypothetical protein
MVRLVAVIVAMDTVAGGVVDLGKKKTKRRMSGDWVMWVFFGGRKHQDPSHAIIGREGVREQTEFSGWSRMTASWWSRRHAQVIQAATTHRSGMRMEEVAW